MWSVVTVLTLGLIIISVHTHWLEPGALCKTRNGTNGICRHFLNCTTAIEEVQANGSPEICNFEGIYPIVCCEFYNPTVNSRIVLAEPGTVFHFTPFDESNKNLRKCRDMYPRIVEAIPPNAFIGGRYSLSQEFPHMALLGYGESDNIQWVCGGSLISNKFVLTAAHCLHSRLFGKLRFIRLGELDLNSTTDDADPQDFTVGETYPHPNYTFLSTYHDIALVRLDRPVKITDYVKPACVGITKNLTNEIPEAMGWGLTENGGKPANILQAGILSFVSNEICRKIYRTSSRYKDGFVDEFQICADGGGLRKDTCQGDSGGPLQIKNYYYQFNSFPEIVGITSFGKQCALVAGVYTRVSTYISWIEDIVWPNE